MKILIFLFMLMAARVAAVYAQDGVELEARYRAAERMAAAEQSALDSLNALMQTTVQSIEKEKKKTYPDQARIVQWMAHGVIMSNQIKEKQKRLSEKENTAEELRRNLEAYYVRNLDSLRRLASSAERPDLGDKIMQLTEKRLLVSPAVKTLAFDPQQVKQMELSKAADPLEKAMMTDYLKKALVEIDARLERVSSFRQEYESIASLRKRTMEFVAESYEQGRLGTAIRSQSVTVPAGQLSGGPLTGEYTTFQARSVVGLIQQINAGVRMTPLPFATLSSKSNVSEEEYIDLLKQAEKQLKNYRDLVQKKLK